MIGQNFAVAVPIGFWHEDLPLTLRSLVAQNVTLEVALLDCSGDPRVQEAANASGIDFVYRRHGPDAGQAFAIAEGWAHTQADILFWLNADDRLINGALERVGAIFDAAPDCDVVFGGSYLVNAARERFGKHEQVSDISSLLLRSNTISQPSCFARRSAVESVGGVDRNLHYVMDWDLWIRLYKSGARFIRIEDMLSEVYMGAGTKTERLSPGRMGEIFALVNRHRGPWAAVKSTLSAFFETFMKRGITR
ncbi:glycosyltransferase [Hyphobacterium sp.]|uniref:glycosyltransferase n=1 Tax=Hyphobacterium sp. TaxID=2004662 RepID=UPI003748F384